MRQAVEAARKTQRASKRLSISPNMVGKADSVSPLKYPSETPPASAAEEKKCAKMKYLVAIKPKIVAAMAIH